MTANMRAVLSRPAVRWGATAPTTATAMALGATARRVMVGWLFGCLEPRRSARSHDTPSTEAHIPAR